MLFTIYNEIKGKIVWDNFLAVDSQIENFGAKLSDYAKFYKYDILQIKFNINHFKISNNVENNLSQILSSSIFISQPYLIQDIPYVRFSF